ncbi:MAG: FtsQ-type POTRA domain-containing protein [Desulfovibrionales bacterium]|nr:FtsQ-type POTRA domain-containing protein [Desulfovibrionales bacterium]
MAGRRQKKVPLSVLKNRYRRKASGIFRAKGTSLLLSWAITLFTGLTFIVIMSVGLLFSYRFITNSTFFAVQGIHISGNVRLEQEDVLDLTQLKSSDNTLAVNISEIERKLLRSPWIQNVSVKRQLPGNFFIAIEEKEPRYWIRRDDRILYADEKGTPIDYVGTYKFASLPFLSVDQGTEHLLQYLPDLVEMLNRASLPVTTQNAAWVRLSMSHGVTLYLESEQLTLSIGVDDWSSNLRHMANTVADLKRRNEFSTVREIKAADENVWVSVSDASKPVR